MKSLGGYGGLQHEQCLGEYGYNDSGKDGESDVDNSIPPLSRLVTTFSLQKLPCGSFCTCRRVPFCDVEEQNRIFEQFWFEIFQFRPKRTQ
jgi:hypothetical protein